MSTLTGSYDFKTSKNTKDVAAADATSKANEAKKVATNFISSDSSGIMIYDGTGGAKTPSSPGTNTKNVFIDSDSVDIRKGSNVLATFGADGATIGVGTESHSVIDANGMRIYAQDGTTLITDLGYGVGTAETGTAIAPYYTFGRRLSGSTIGNWSVAEGGYTTASGYMSHAEGINTTASGVGAHAEGSNGAGSPYGPIASGEGSHAEGNQTKATAQSAHSEGTLSEANGKASHAQNNSTIANGNAQTTLGKYNIADTTSAVIIGNGTGHSARSNALTVDWNGNVNIASGAKYKINGTNLSASDVGAAPAAGSSSLVNSAQGKIIGRSEICYANSRVDRFTNGEVTVANSSLGVTTGSKPVGILLTPSSSTVVMRYHYDGSDGTNSNIRAYNLDGSGFTGNLRYFAVVFQNTWTTT